LKSLQLFGPAAILIALGLTGCGNSGPLAAEEEAGEAYLQELLA
jgi:predicted small lipoprotein YifL